MRLFPDAWWPREITDAQRGDVYDCGIGKLESLSRLSVAALMGLVFIVITVNAVRGLLSPSHVGGIGVTTSLVAQVVVGSILKLGPEHSSPSL